MLRERGNVIMETTELKSIIASTMKNVIYEVLDEDRYKKYIDGFKMNVGGYTFSIIDRLDKETGVNDVLANKKKRAMLDALRDEFDKVNNSKFNPDTMLLDLQLEEYEYRNKILAIYNSSEMEMKKNGYTK